MALSYVVTSAAVAFLLLATAAVAGLVLLANLLAAEPTMLARTAATYADVVAAHGSTISSAHPFPLGNVNGTTGFTITPSGTSLQVRYLRARPQGQMLDAVVLAVDAEGAIAGTSYPARYPAGRRLTSIVPGTGPALKRLLGGEGSQQGAATTVDGPVLWAMHPVDAAGRVAGAVYAQAPQIRQAQDVLPVSTLPGAALFLAALVIEEVGGVAELRTDPGSGSCLVVTLPGSPP
jgi:hypothetical protein